MKRKKKISFLFIIFALFALLLNNLSAANVEAANDENIFYRGEENFNWYTYNKGSTAFQNFVLVTSDGMQETKQIAYCFNGAKSHPSNAKDGYTKSYANATAEQFGSLVQINRRPFNGNVEQMQKMIKNCIYFGYPYNKSENNYYQQALEKTGGNASLARDMLRAATQYCVWDATDYKQAFSWVINTAKANSGLNSSIYEKDALELGAKIYTEAWKSISQPDADALELDLYTPIGDTAPQNMLVVRLPNDETPHDKETPLKETVTVSGTKTWSGDQEETRPVSIEVKLKQKVRDQIIDTGQVMTVSDDNGWSYSFTDLPKHNEQGELIDYFVEENTIPEGYTPIYSHENAPDTYDICNQYEKTDTTTHSSSVEIALKGTKSLNNGNLLDGQFSFNIVDDNGEVKSTGTNDANGNIMFSPITFSQSGIYHFIVKEVIPADVGDITYDTVEYPITITVSDDDIGYEPEFSYYGTFENNEQSNTNKFWMQNGKAGERFRVYCMNHNQKYTSSNIQDDAVFSHLKSPSKEEIEKVIHVNNFGENIVDVLRKVVYFNEQNETEMTASDQHILMWYAMGSKDGSSKVTYKGESYVAKELVEQIILSTAPPAGYNLDMYIPKDYVTKDEESYQCFVRGYQMNTTVEGADNIVFTNTQTPKHSLTISKKVTGEAGDITKGFTFNLSLEQCNGNDCTPVNGDFQAILTSAKDQSQEEKVISFVDGQTTVALSHGQQIILKDLPYGATYKVTEQEANSDHYTTTYNKEKIEFAMGILDDDKQVEVENNKEFVPATGLSDFMGTQSLVATGIFAVLLLILSTALLLHARKIRRR